MCKEIKMRIPFVVNLSSFFYLSSLSRSFFSKMRLFMGKSLDSLIVIVIITLSSVRHCSSYTYEQKNKTFYHVINDLKQVKPDYPTRGNLFAWLNPKSLVKFRLWTRLNPHFAQEIKYKDVDSLKTSNFDNRRLTKIIIHGFADGASEANIGDWLIFMRDAYLKLGDVNVIVVDYSIHALFTRYLTARPETVAERVAEMLMFLVSNAVSLESFHLIGWSWGAHICGMAGHLLNGALNRISGIDPAGPTFKFVDNEFRLDKSDAQFVDILHVNGGTRLFWGAHFGLKDALGHVDIYANGGERQIGCPKERTSIFETLWCSHGRAPKLWTESITSPLAFPSCPCESLDKYVKGECICNKNTIAYWGEHVPHNTRGIFQIITRSHKPFGHGPQIRISLPNITDGSYLQDRSFDNFLTKPQSAEIEFEHKKYNVPFRNTYNTFEYPNNDVLNMSLEFIRNVSNYLL